MKEVPWPILCARALYGSLFVTTPSKNMGLARGMAVALLLSVFDLLRSFYI